MLILLKTFGKLLDFEISFSRVATSVSDSIRFIVDYVVYHGLREGGVVVHKHVCSGFFPVEFCV